MTYARCYFEACVINYTHRLFETHYTVAIMDTTPVNIRVSTDQPPKPTTTTLKDDVTFNTYLIDVNKQQENTINTLTEALADKDRQQLELESTCDSLESKNGMIRNFLKTQYELNESNLQLHPTLASLLTNAETTTFYTAVGMGVIVLFCLLLSTLHDTLSPLLVLGVSVILCLLIWAQCRLLQSSRSAFLAFQTVVKENEGVQHTNDMVHTLIDTQY